MKLRSSIAVLALALLLVALSPTSVLALTDLVQPGMKVPPMVPEKSVSVYLPSESAAGDGIAVNIIYPEKSRYKEGAPVVVVVPGGVSPDGLSFDMHAAQAGMIEVRFEMPGGVYKKVASSGIYDNRGPNSQLALRDVILFAAGKKPDAQGNTITSAVPVPVDTNNVGVVGWDNGGNMAIITMAKYADSIPFISWVAFYESPIGSLFVPPNLGSSKDFMTNHHYRQGSAATGECLIDYRKLAYDARPLVDGEQRKKSGEPVIRGALFFDENHNGLWDESTEFAFKYATDIGLEKQIYPPEVSIAAERLHIFDKAVLPVSMNQLLAEEEKKSSRKDDGKKKGKHKKLASLEEAAKQKAEKEEKKAKIKWPYNIATVAESDAYYHERDGSLYIARVCQKYPKLLVTVFASQIDHLQSQPDHPHIALQYNAWLSNKLNWIRLNPEPAYILQVAAMNPYNFPNNKPNESIDWSDLDTMLEPDGLLPDYVFMEATVAELADRVHAKEFKSPLTMPVVNYNNGVVPQPAAAQQAPAQPAQKN